MASASTITTSFGADGNSPVTIQAAPASGKIFRVPAGALTLYNSSGVEQTLDIALGGTTIIKDIVIPDGATWVNSGNTAFDFIIDNGDTGGLQIVWSGYTLVLTAYAGALEGDA